MVIKKGSLGHLFQKSFALERKFSVLLEISLNFPERPSKGLFHDLHIQSLLALRKHAYAKCMQISNKASGKISK